MKFHVGDVVVRPPLGLCRISGITRMEIDGQTLEMYELEANEGTVRVPVLQAESGGFRYPVDEAGAEEIVRLLSEPVKVDEVQEFVLDVREAMATIRNRDLPELARLVRILFNKEKDFDLDKREAETLNSAMRCLTEEIAHLRRTIKGKVTSELKKAMAAARKERRGMG